MIDTVLNLVFRCPHRRLTRPVTPVSKAGVPQGDTYVVCLDCGKQFHYDVKEMRMGKAINRSPESGVLQPAMPMPRKRKLQVALWASVPLAILAGALLRRKAPPAENKPEPGGDRRGRGGAPLAAPAPAAEAPAPAPSAEGRP